MWGDFASMLNGAPADVEVVAPVVVEDDAADDAPAEPVQSVREQREQRCNGLVVRDPAALWETGTEIRGAGAAAIDGEICADCGTFWKPNAKVKSAEMREEIRKLRLEVDSAIDILGDLVSNDG